MKIQIGENFYRELTEGEAWTTHPGGGIIVCHRDRKPLWCRMEDGAYRQDWIEYDPLEANAQLAALSFSLIDRP